jgi:hypothetical protein
VNLRTYKVVGIVLMVLGGVLTVLILVAAFANLME